MNIFSLKYFLTGKLRAPQLLSSSSGGGGSGGGGSGSGKFATLKKSLFLVVMARDAVAVLALVICI